jgi:hypothetical protein
MGGFMDISESMSLAKYLASNISAIHISNGRVDKEHCVSCDQEYPCLTVQFSRAIEATIVIGARGPRGRSASKSNSVTMVTDALQVIAQLAEILFDRRSQEFSDIFEQLTMLHGLTGITQTGFGNDSHALLQVNLIHPRMPVPTPLWSIRANLVTQQMHIKLWLNPSETSVTRPFLVDMMVATMTPIEAADLIDWWQAPDMAAACEVDYLMPPNGTVMANIVGALVTATIEAAQHVRAETVLDWDDFCQE